MTRVRQSQVAVAPKFINPPAVKPQTKAKLKAAFEKALKSDVQFRQQPLPLGTRYVRVPLKKERGADGFTYTALIPVGALAPGAKPANPNTTKGFLIERSGGLAGITMIAGPVGMDGKKLTKPVPFFEHLLENQNAAAKPPAGGVQTKKYPSDQEDAGARKPPGSSGVQTKKYPSDNEDGSGTRPGGAVTAKAPSDAEDGGGARPGPGGAVTRKAPSDNEDGGGTRPGGPGGAVTAKAPSDAEDGGGTIGTKKYPSDNEDGGGGAVTAKAPSDNEDGGGMIGTKKYPSDNEDGGGARPGDGLVTTMKAPSDNEDGGGVSFGVGSGRGPADDLTRKAPSDSDE